MLTKQIDFQWNTNNHQRASLCAADLQQNHLVLLELYFVCHRPKSAWIVWRTEKLYSITCSIQTFSSTFCFSSSVSTLSASIVVLKTPVWKLMKRYCCVFLYMFSLSACVQSCVQGTWENQIFIIAPFFNTVLANQNHHAQSFLANSNILPCNVRGHYRSPLTFPGFHSIFHRTTMMQAFGSLLIFRKWVLTFSRHWLDDGTTAFSVSLESDFSKLTKLWHIKSISITDT